MKQGETNILVWKAIKNGDLDAFDRLYKENVQMLFQYGVNLGIPKEAIKDAIQELFIILWRKRADIQMEKSVKNYLLLSFRRILFKKSNLQIVEITDYQNHQLVELPKVFPTDDQITKQDQIQKVQEALKFLPKRQREAIFLKYFENLDSEEIAKVMGIQIGAVYKLVSVGIKKLRKII